MSSAAVPADQTPTNVTISASNLAGALLLEDVSVAVPWNCSVKQFVHMVTGCLSQPMPGHHYIFTSSRFSDVLCESKVGPDSGLTESNDTPLTDLCQERLQEAEHLSLQATTVATELHRTQCEETEGYAQALEQAEYEYLALPFCYICARNTGVFSYSLEECLCSNQEKANSWWEKPRHDLKAVMDESSVALERELRAARYVCPFAAGTSCCTEEFGARDELLEHLQAMHANEKLQLPIYYCIEMRLVGTAGKFLEGLEWLRRAEEFLFWAQEQMFLDGFQFESPSGPIRFCRFRSTSHGPWLLEFTSDVYARAFFDRFHQYEWKSSDQAQPTFVLLSSGAYKE